MAINFAGGTDTIYHVIAGTPPAIGCIAFWMRTTQATVNVSVVTYWNSASRAGWGVELNTTANKIRAQGWDVSAARVSILSTTSVNDGNPHHVVFNYNRNNGGANELFIDGASEATANSSAGWGSGSSGFWLQAGDNADSFWAAYVGDLWERAHWNRQLTADEIASLAKGAPASRIAFDSLLLYSPWTRDTRGIIGQAAANVTGTTVSPGGRMMGGNI